MWEHFGIFRSEEQLKQGIKKIKTLKTDYNSKAYVSQASKLYNLSLIDALILEGMLEVSLIIAESSLRRTESRGSHYRIDYPERDDKNWLKHTLIFNTQNGFKFDSKSVKISKWPLTVREY
jgi:succinate dehydrogenase / fumarate reductase flavoprotein subunit